jgi:hypothetical protein
MSSLKQTDAASAAVYKAPRVSLEDIEAAIAERHDLRASDAIEALDPSHRTYAEGAPLKLLSVCILVLKNGFSVVGVSAPASPENYNADLGKQYAYENAVRQIWPLMGFALRDRLHKG